MNDERDTLHDDEDASLGAPVTELAALVAPPADGEGTGRLLSRVRGGKCGHNPFAVAIALTSAPEQDVLRAAMPPALLILVVPIMFFQQAQAKSQESGR